MSTARSNNEIPSALTMNQKFKKYRNTLWPQATVMSTSIILASSAEEPASDGAHGVSEQPSPLLIGPMFLCDCDFPSG